MAKVSLKATGGLNKDVDLNLLPEGDYSDATNIIFDSGKTGGAGAIKMLESISTTGLSFVNGTADTVKATFTNTDGYIYVLTKNGTSAYIYRIAPTLDTKEKILTYTHEVSTDFTPDLRVLDNCIVWNYHGLGSVLLYSLSGWTSSVTVSFADLSLQKKTPNNVVTIYKHALNLTNGLQFLEESDIQFASRYQYKSGEFSVLGNYSQMYKAEKGITQYDLSYDFTGKPTFAEYLEVYARIGNTGIWRRIDTNRIGVDSASFTWIGQLYESLDSTTTSKPFDAVPVSAKHIEIAKNRIFLANIVDDYQVSTANLDFALEESGTGYPLSTTSGTANSYLNTSLINTTSANSSELSATSYVKPFANNSIYAIGLAYYDEAMKTRGVEKYIKFKTGKFVYPVLPQININLGSTWIKPSWAKYAQLVYTKNISKSYVYEGYASNIFFVLKEFVTDPTTKVVTEVKKLTQSIDSSQFSKLNYCVIDLMGMFVSGEIYTLNAGDRITINTNSSNGILDMSIEQQSGNFLYCKYNGKEMSNSPVPDAKKLYFEIYSPSVVKEDDSLLFYEYGSLMNISSWSPGTISVTGDGTLNTNKLIGDMIFDVIEMPSYTTAPFVFNTTKSSPAVILDGALTKVKSTNFTTLTHAESGAYLPKEDIWNPVFNGFVADGFGVDINADEAHIIDNTGSYSPIGKYIGISGYYDAANQELADKISINYNISMDVAFTMLTPTSTAGLDIVFKAEVYRFPYNNTTNTYGAEAIYGTTFILNELHITDTDYSNSFPFMGTQELVLSSIGTDLAANDKFYIKLTLDTYAFGDVASSSVSVYKKTGSADAIEFIINADRTAPVVITTYNTNSIIGGTKAPYLIRSTSKATANKTWNTSAGKPVVQSSIKSNTITSRKNTIRYGGNYVAGTNVNNLSSFFALDSADVPVENGQIMSLQRASRLQGTGTMLLALCEKETSYALLGEQELTQGNNAGLVSVSNNVIGTIKSLGYNYGLQEKGSVYNQKGTIWWWDNFNKKIAKFSSDNGLELPSDVFMRSEYLKKSGDAKFAYDPFYNIVFVGIGSDTYSYGYSITLNRWVSKYTFVSDFAENYGDKMIVFKGNVPYKSLQSGYNAFLGTSAVDSTITLTLNSRLPIMPLNVSVSHDMNVMDYTQTVAGTYDQPNMVKANLLSIAISNENGQASAIVESNFIAEDNRLYAHVLRDTSNGGDIISGKYIVGYLNNFVVSLKDKTQNMRLNSLDIEAQSVSGHS
jgi:hypothetical protein